MRAIRSKMVLKARFRSVPVCSAVGENTREHAAKAKHFVSVRLRYAWPTVYFEPLQLSLDIDWLAVENVENVDHFGKLGGEEQ